MARARSAFQIALALLAVVAASLELQALTSAGGDPVAPTGAPAAIDPGSAHAQHTDELTDTVRVEADFGVLVVEYEHEVLYDPDTSLLFAKPAFLALDGEGRIYASDFDDKTVVGLTPDGEHRFTSGGEGEGPGEMSDAWVIAATPSGDVYLLDRFTQRIHAFGPDGTFRQALAIPELGMTDPKSLLALDEERLLLAAVSAQEPHAGYALHVLEVHSRAGEEGGGDERPELRLVDSFVDLEETDVEAPDVRWFLLGGQASLTPDGDILYSQSSPFEISRLSPEGEIHWQIDDPDAWPHWREFMRTLPNGRLQPDAFTQSRGLWSLGDGIYLHAIQQVTEEYRELRRSKPASDSCECETYRDLHEILWIDRGRIARRARFDSPTALSYRSQDDSGHLYGIDPDTGAIVRTRVRLRIE